MRGFFRRLTRRDSVAPLNERNEREAGEMADLFATLREIEPDPTARSEGRTKLQAAVVTARVERNRPRLAGVRAFSIAVAGIAGSSVLVASAATGTDPMTLVVNVADWSVPAWDRSSELSPESVTVSSYDSGTGILEGMTVDGVPLTLLLSEASRDSSPSIDGLEPGTRIEVTIESRDDTSEPQLVTSVEVVSTPPPDLALEPAPSEEAARPRIAAPTATPHPTQPPATPRTDETDKPTVATVEPSPTEPKDEGDADSDLSTGSLVPVPTRTPTAEPTPWPVEPTPKSGSTFVDEVDSTATNLNATEDGDETKVLEDETSLR